MGTRAVVHLADQTLHSYGLGKLDDVASASVSKHIGGCGSCRRRVAELSSDEVLGRLRYAEIKPDVAASGWSPSADSSPESAGGWVVALPPADSLPPGLADHPDYEVVKELGRGGMGVVYLAHNKLMGRLEVLKVVGGHLVERPGVLDRFLREIRSAAMLQHTNIVTAYTAMRLGQSIALAMEYVEGLDLARMVKARGPLSIAHASYFVHQAALGLQHAHERGMVHRDIKPANLILARDGKKATVKVLDFGLAKVTSEGQSDSGLTREGQMLGTPDFIAPEQIRDAQSADIRADIYSLGCTFYYLLTGGPPFHGEHLWDLYQAHFSMEAGPLNLVRPAVPVELAAVVAKMMAKEPGERFQTPGDVARALTPFFKPVATQPAGPSAEMPRPAAQASSNQPSSASPTATQPATLASAPALTGRRPSKTEGDWVAWERLIETKETGQPVAPAQAVVPARQPLWVWPAVVIGLLIFGLSAAWLGGVFRVTTPEGMIVLENLPNDAQVFVDGRKITLSWPGIGKPVEIRAVPGQRKVEVKQDGFSTFANELNVKAGGSTEVTVRLEPLDAGLSKPEAGAIATPAALADAGDNFPVKGTPYRLINLESGKALEARTRDVVQANVSKRIVVHADVSDSENQLWYFSEVPTTGKYKIFNSKNGLSINISNAGPERFSIILYPDIGGERGEDNAVWFLRFEGRAVRIATTWPGVVSSSDVNVLEVTDGSGDEERVVQRPRKGGRHELWRWVVASAESRAVGNGDRPPVSQATAERQLVLRSPAEKRARVIRGQWTREGEELVQTSLETDTELVFGDPSWSHYNLSLEVKKDTEAVDGRRFTVLFHRVNERTKCWYSGYSSAHEIASAVDGRWSRDFEMKPGNWVWSRPNELEAGRWYPFTIEVRGRSVRCYFDNALMFNDAHPSLTRGRIALGSYRTQVRFRRIKITDPNGRVLFEGMPEIDPGPSLSDRTAISVRPMMPPAVPVPAAVAAGKRESASQSVVPGAS